MKKNNLFYFCGFFCLTAIIYGFLIKAISLQLFIVGILLFVPGLMGLLPSIGQNRLYNLICGFLIGMACLWMAIDVHPTRLYFGLKDFTYSLQRIIFGTGFVFFGLGCGILLFIELKNKWKQRKKTADNGEGGSS